MSKTDAAAPRHTKQPIIRQDILEDMLIVRAHLDCLLRAKKITKRQHDGVLRDLEKTVQV